MARCDQDFNLHTNVTGNPYFEDETLAEVGFSMENNVGRRILGGVFVADIIHRYLGAFQKPWAIIATVKIIIPLT